MSLKFIWFTNHYLRNALLDKQIGLGMQLHTVFFLCVCVSKDSNNIFFWDRSPNYDLPHYHNSLLKISGKYLQLVQSSLLCDMLKHCKQNVWKTKNLELIYWPFPRWKAGWHACICFTHSITVARHYFVYSELICHM